MSRNNESKITVRDPMPFELDFMVRPTDTQTTATYFNGQQFEAILCLLRGGYDPVTISEVVCMAVSGIDITAADVEETKNGNFHVSGSRFNVRLLNSGNLLPIDVVDDFYHFLPNVDRLESMRPLIEREYGFVLPDSDLSDLADGSFHVAGPRTIDLTTRERSFVPRADSSEALWMLEKGFSDQFVTDYVWYRFGSNLSTQELRRLAWLSNEDMIEDAQMDAIIKSAPPTRAFDPPCLKQTPCRAPPPLPIATHGLLPKHDAYAVHVHGGTYTANSAVACRFDDGTYCKYFDFRCGPNSDTATDDADPKLECGSGSDSRSAFDLQSAYDFDSGAMSDNADLGSGCDSDSDATSEHADSESDCSVFNSRVLVHLQDGDFLVDLDQPDRGWIRVPRPDPLWSNIDRTGFASNVPLGSALRNIDTEANEEDDLVLNELDSNSHMDSPDILERRLAHPRVLASKFLED
jgi:hypothetical protein